MSNRNICTNDAAAHYTQTSGSSRHYSPAAGLSTACGCSYATHIPLATSPNTFLAIGGTMSDEMFTRPIGCEWNHMADDFGQFYTPLDVVFARSPRSRAATTTNPNNIGALSALASLAPTVDGDEIAGQAVAQVVCRNRIRLTARDAVFIYQQKYRKTARMAVQLGKEYNVTAKTVRDIWRQRTWRHSTREHSSNGTTAIANGDTAIEDLAPPSPLAEIATSPESY